MSELTKILRSEITRVAKREARGLVGPTRKSSIVAKQGLAALKRRVAELERAVSKLKKSTKDVSAVFKPVDAGRNRRFSSSGVRAMRERLGMSAEDFGKLLSVSSQSIYNWEHGTAKPRSALLDKLAVVRAFGKREALAQLRSLDGSVNRA